MKTLLWLDDVRDPTTNDWLVFSPIGRDVNVVWVKRYREFVGWIKENGLPDGICFDHDIESFHISKSTYVEKTGFDCAKWLVDYCIDNDLDLPAWNIQSDNPIGKNNINGLLNNYRKNRK